MMRWLCWWRPPCLLRRVIVNFTHDPTEAFEGILWSCRGPWLTLRDVSALKANLPPVPVAGEMVIPRERIAYLQVAP
jgi:hypothetical protein